MGERRVIHTYCLFHELAMEEWREKRGRRIDRGVMNREKKRHKQNEKKMRG